MCWRTLPVNPVDRGNVYGGRGHVLGYIGYERTLLMRWPAGGRPK